MNRLFVFLISVFSISAFGAVLNVTNYGAWGDAMNLYVVCTANSYTVTGTNTFTSADVGKVITIFGGGVNTTPSNNMDLCAQIASVNNNTNIVLNRPAGCTTNPAYAIFGTCCSTGLQAAINISQVGDTISIPAGRYLVIPPVFDTNWLWGKPRFVDAAVVVRKGGIHLLGDDPNNTVLIGNGAFQKTRDGSVYRGQMFYFQCPFTNALANQLTFDGMTLDGGVPVGRTSNQGYPANVNTGDGWDLTHDAIIWTGSALPFCTNNALVNLTFQHWRGEILKSAFDERTGDFYGITNCIFRDGNASGVNLQFSSAISGCTFTNLDLTMECYASIGLVPYYFEFNTCTNCRAGNTISGAQTNRQPQVPYLVQSNDFGNTGWGVNVSPAQNVTIKGNYFHDMIEAVLIGGEGAQGNAAISNIMVFDNVATNCEKFISFYSSGYSIFVTNNIADFGIKFNEPFADGGTATNTYFYNNFGNARDGLVFSADSTVLPYDDLSNVFPYRDYDDPVGQTNVITYTLGARHRIRTIHSGAVWRLDDTPHMPSGAEMIVTNASGSTVSLYRSTKNQVPAVIMTNGYSARFKWTNGVWRTLFAPAWTPNLQVIPPVSP